MVAVRRLAVASALMASLSTACGASHTVPDQPTWADVEPILGGECLSCHGATAATTGSFAGATYRFDFFNLTPDVCGDAASAVEPMRFAEGWSEAIALSITSVDPSTRPKMPPLPAPWLPDWEWQTILRWSNTQHPIKGPIPAGNRLPVLSVRDLASSADTRLRFSAVLEDPDGESAVGIITIGDVKLKLDRPGSFTFDLDTSIWTEGDLPVGATVCDGWDKATYGYGSISVAHALALQPHTP